MLPPLTILVLLLPATFGQVKVKKTITKSARNCFPGVNGAKPNDTVVIHYTGHLTDGTQFDSSIGSDPISFQLGIGRVIKGWDDGIVGSCKGEKFRLEIPSSLGYGTRGAGNAIPPNADLIFDCTLVDIKGVIHHETLLAKNCKSSEKSRSKDKVSFYYSGHLPNGTIFALADEATGALTAEIGKTGIKGWDEALKGLCVGEKKRTFIPPHLGYGEEGIKGSVPPNSTVYLDVEMINIQDRVVSFLERFSSGLFSG